MTIQKNFFKTKFVFRSFPPRLFQLATNLIQGCLKGSFSLYSYFRWKISFIFYCEFIYFNRRWQYIFKVNYMYRETLAMGQIHTLFNFPKKNSRFYLIFSFKIKVQWDDEMKVEQFELTRSNSSFILTVIVLVIARYQLPPTT